MDKGNEKKGLIQLICVLLAFILWLYVTSIESPNKSAEIKNIKVELVNTEILQESNLAISPNQDFEVDLKIEGPANSVYSANPEDFKITGDLGTYVLKKGENLIPVSIKNYPKNINIKNTGILSIKVNLEEYSEKNVDVVSKVDLKYEKGYGEIKSTISPSSVKVSGADSAVKSVDTVALMGEKQNVENDFEESFQLVALDEEGEVVEGVAISTGEGMLSLKVGKTIEVPIKIKYSGVLKEGLTIENATLSRSHISVTGDPNLIDRLGVIETEEINLSNIMSSSEISIRLVSPTGVFIKDEEQYIKVNLSIKDSTPITKEFEVPISFTGTNEAYKYAASNIMITLQGKKEDLEKISSNNIKVSVDVTSLDVGEHVLSWVAKLVNVEGDTVKINNSGGNITINISNNV